MKRNISELLDGVPVDDVDLNEKTPLSARRIKAKTLSQVGRKNRTTVRWLPRVALIAAVIMLMTVSVFAADVVLNEGTLFSVFFGNTLSDDEVTLVDDIGKTIGQSVTRNGATITAVQAIADESFCWLHLRVEAPEGVILPDMKEDETYYYYFAGRFLSDFQVQHRYTSDDPWNGLASAHMVKPLPDPDTSDNLKEFILIVHGEEGRNTFRRSGQTRLIIPGLYIHKGKDPYQKLLFAGNFVFDISMDNIALNDYKRVIDTGGITFDNEKYGYTTRVSKVTISPLHIDVDFSTTEPNDPCIFPNGGPVELVMKDGTKIHALDAWFDARNQIVADQDDVAGPKVEYFTAPVVVQDIDYIIVGGEYIFDVN